MSFDQHHKSPPGDRYGHHGFRQKGGGPPGSGNPSGKNPGGQDIIWPSKNMLGLLSKGLVHPSYRLSMFCPMISKGAAFEPKDGKEQVYKDTITAINPRAQSIAKSWRSRRNSWLDPLVSKGLALRFEVIAKTRVVLWLSSPSATELGFCLHHVYGIPYLPPSALKGLASKAMWKHVCPQAEWDELSDQILDLFGEGGDEGHVGRVAFLEGIPLGDEKGQICLETDVMTPHHASYYSGKEAPHDCEGPNPLPFLCIPPGQRFEIGLIFTRGGDQNGPTYWLSEAKRWLINGLSQMGLGAKTSSNYGIMVEVGSSPTSISSQIGGSTENAESSSPVESGPSLAPAEIIATIISTDRGNAEGIAKAADGETFSFSCADLAKLGIYRKDWQKEHGQAYIFQKQGDRFVLIRKKDS